MTYSTLTGVVIAALAASSPLACAQSGPRNGWSDSYSIGGKCYCDTTFDHNIGGLMVPGTGMNVRQACAAAGEGPMTIGSEKRLYYNDIQCGNGPANDAGDEDWCPGRVDLGTNNKSGCNDKGPKFSFNNNPEPEPESKVQEEVVQEEVVQEATFEEQDESLSTGAILTGLSVVDVASGAITALGANPSIMKSDYPDGFSILADVSDPSLVQSVKFSDLSNYEHTEHTHAYDMFGHKSWPNPPTGIVVITVVATMKDGTSEALEATVDLM